MRQSDALAEETASLRLTVRSVVAAVLGLSPSHPDVEDCAQDALSRALEGRDRLRGGEPLRPWVIGIARHVAIDAIRSNKRARARSVTTTETDEGEVSLIDRVADPSPGPEERADTNERADRLSQLLAGLPADQRTALILFHVDGLKYQAIADKLKVPMGTVATWIARGRKTIADALGNSHEVES